MILQPLLSLPTGFEMWSPAWQASTLFLSTFVLEDVAAIGAGLLVASGVLGWPLAFSACFFGIWLGDAGLYSVARVIGRNCFERTSLRRHSSKVAQSERWFAERGSSILVFSRLLPGARLPTYLAAGFLRVPLDRFLLITGTASLVWTLCVLLVSQKLGAQVLLWLGPLRKTAWAMLVVVAACLAALHLARKLALQWRYATTLCRSRRSESALNTGARTASADEPVAQIGTALIEQHHWSPPQSSLGRCPGGTFENSPTFSTLGGHVEEPLKSRRDGRNPMAIQPSLRDSLSRWTAVPNLRNAFHCLQLRRLLTRLERWTHWEFWPAWLFYPPVALYGLRLAIKYRGLALPTTANPGIFSGGIIGESKMATLEKLMETSPDFTAEAELLTGSTPEQGLDSLHEICRRRNIDYPFILKPDVGQRGAGVRLIRNEDQALTYLRQTSAPLMVQRYAPGPHEVGVFYYRYPREPHGHIFAITEKVFPVVTGDGTSTVSELIWADPRARFLAAKYLERLDGRENEILAKGQTLKLVEAGNHAQGCIFRDGMPFCSPELTLSVDVISQKISGFYIGRYDLRYASEQDLRAGRNFKIIELNGAASEATSIYDARNSILTAYRTLFRQWELVFAIGAANRQAGAVPTKLSALWQAWRDYARRAATYPVAD